MIFKCDVDSGFVTFTSDELQAAYRNLKTYKSVGPGNIPSAVIREVVMNELGSSIQISNFLEENRG